MGALGRPRFLAVDDEPLAQRTYRGALSKYGEAVIVGSIAEARAELARVRSWSAFLFDLWLLDGSGLELLAHARESHPRTPALVLSGYVECWVANEAFDLGAETLGKPFDRPRLHRWVERALGLQRPPPIASLQPIAVRERIETLRELLARRPADAAIRYQIGRIVADLKARPDLYGVCAVATAADTLGKDEVSLYRHARVAERWPASDFDALLARKMRDRRSPSWSHLVLLAPVDSAQVCSRLVERMLDESMSVRQLEAAICYEGHAEDLHGPPER